MCCEKRNGDYGLSSVVGEMLMLAAVVVILAIVSVNAQALLPPPRDPVVTVLVRNTTDNVTFYHKGGDAVRVGELAVVVGKVRITHTSPSFLLNGDPVADPADLFDLGDAITITRTPGENEPVRLATARAVLWSGVIP